MKTTKILLFSMHAGGGHIAAAQAVKDYLGDSYEVIEVSLFSDILWPLDPISLVTAKKFNLPDLYNYFARKKSYALINTLGNVWKIVMPLFAKKTQTLINRSIKKHQPDLVISVIPIVNGLIASAAKEHDLPFVLIPTDLDTTWFTWFFPEKQYPKGVFTVAFDDPTLTKNNNLSELGIATRVVGFPIRKSFFEPKDIVALKKEFKVQSGVPVILMLMGAQGSKATYEYAKRLALIDRAFHLFVCLGKHEALRRKLETIHFPMHIKVTYLGFTDRMADIMAISDVCLSKSGSVSVCEALYMNLPLILDSATTVLQWERFNHDFIQRKGFGEVIYNYDQVGEVLKKYLVDKEHVAKIKRNISLYKKENFGHHITELVHDMLKK